VVHVKGKENNEIKFIVKIFANGELPLRLCKIPVWRNEFNARFERYRNQTYY
jgi:hypothetical protein